MSRIVSGLLLVLIVGVALGQLVGQPMLLAFVETGSMQPTLDPGDGFLTMPPMLAGELQEGDVITYRAREIGGGGLTTHRIVEVTESGFITAGDANPFTDQAGGEPLVTRPQVVAVGVQVGGHLIVLPELGTVIGVIGGGIAGFQRMLGELFGTQSLVGVQGLGVLLLLTSIIGYFVDVVFGTSKKRRRRDTSRRRGYRVIVLAVFVGGIIALAATAAMVAPSGTETYTVDSVEPGANVEGGIVAGTERTVKATVANAGFVPTFVVFEPRDPGINVGESTVMVWPRVERSVAVTLTAPAEPGRYRLAVTHHRYLAVLPRSIIVGLHQYHPWAAILAIDGAIVASAILGALVVTRRRRIRVRPGRDRRGQRLSRWVWGREGQGD